MKNPFIGKVLNKDIFAHNGLLLLSIRTVIRDEHIEKLLQQGIFLTDEDVFAVKPNFYKEKTNEFIPLKEFDYKQNSNILKDAFEISKFTKKIHLHEIRREVLPSIREVAKKPDIFTLLSQLNDKGNDIYLHNIGVSVLATSIGRWLGLSEEELSLLTMSALLHDIGKTQIPDHVLNNLDNLSKEDDVIYKRHTFYGYNLLSNTVGMSKRVAIVALQHHERFDGKGYPLGIKKKSIDFFSQIVAVSDVFYNMTNNNVNEESFYTVMSRINEYAYGKLNPMMLTMLISRVMNSTIGNEVILSDGKIGKIIMVNQYEPMNPIIESSGSIIDLSKNRDIHIRKVLF